MLSCMPTASLAWVLKVSTMQLSPQKPWRRTMRERRWHSSSTHAPHSSNCAFSTRSSNPLWKRSREILHMFVYSGAQTKVCANLRFRSAKSLGTWCDKHVPAERNHGRIGLLAMSGAAHERNMWGTRTCTTGSAKGIFTAISSFCNVSHYHIRELVKEVHNPLRNLTNRLHRKCSDLL